MKILAIKNTYTKYQLLNNILKYTILTFILYKITIFIHIIINL